MGGAWEPWEWSVTVCVRSSLCRDACFASHLLDVSSSLLLLSQLLLVLCLCCAAAAASVAEVTDAATTVSVLIDIR